MKNNYNVNLFDLIGKYFLTCYYPPNNLNIAFKEKN